MARKVAHDTATVSVEFPSYLDYTLDGLRQAVNGPRGDFTKWADLHLPPPDLDPSSIFKTVHGYDDGWTVTFDLENKSDWRGYAIGAVFDVLDDILGTCNSSQDVRRVFWRCLPDQARPPNGWDVETIFANVEHLDKELGRTAAALKESEPKILGGEPFRRLKRAEMAAKVELLGPLSQALRGRRKLETVFWTSVQWMAKFYCDILCKVNEKVQSRTPLSGWDLQAMDRMLRYGTVQLRAERGDRGSETWRLCAEPDLYQMHRSRACHCTIYGTALCIPPAYQVAQSLADPAKWPAFRHRCHAPRCGKWFYGSRPECRRCPGSDKCRREWVRYQSWLKEVGKSPEADWDDEELQARFRKTYRPQGRRGRQPCIY